MNQNNSFPSEEHRKKANEIADYICRVVERLFSKEAISLVAKGATKEELLVLLNAGPNFRGMVENALAEAEQTGIEKGLQSEEVKGLLEALRYCALDPRLLAPENNLQNVVAGNALAAFSARLKREIER